jgi:hypothetical protein|tara:strand:+ start:2843 stop:3589 length:747 start_codon:yes stop_codon:yes gene_type:complete
MAKDYKTLVNELLVELNEPEVSTIASAVGIQKQVANVVNRAYFDIVDAVDDWSWLSADVPDDPYYGNTIVQTVVGQRFYLLKAGSANVDSDFDSVNWDMFTLVDTNSPFTINKLPFTTLTTWRSNYAEAEESAARQSNYATPLRVIRSSDGRRFGLSPIPDKVYNIHFFAYNRPTALSADADTVLFPEQYKPVLLARARYYLYQFKDNIAQSQLALDEYKKGLQNMADNLNSPQPQYMSDVRFTYLLP